MNAPQAIATLFICTNCPSAGNVPPTEACPAGAGKALLAAVEAAMPADLAAKVAVQGVKCMGGCQTPCSVALTGNGRETLLFGAMGAARADDILACARTYVEAPPGHRMTKTERPESMRETLNVRVPAAV
jgi:predicted metal-binding protein